MNDRKKLEKKKVREKEVRAKLLVKRAAAQKQAKEDKEERLAEIADRPKLKPIRKGEQMASNFSPLDAEEVKKRLEHNLQILKALEEEYDKEQANRQSRNENMEAQGVEDFKSKLEIAKKQLQKNEYALGGEAGCRVIGQTGTLGSETIIGGQ